MSRQVPERKLSFWGAIALSLGIMAPTLAMSLNGAVPAQMVGAAVPLTFFLSFFGVALVAYSFIRLTGRLNHAGSVYALAGATIGPRAGFFAGWGLLGVYFGFIITTSTATALFTQGLLARAGINVPWALIVAVVLLTAFALCVREVRAVSRSLIGLEGLSVSLILGLLVIVVVTVANGKAPGGQSFSLTPLTPGDAGLSAVLATTVFGFLSWAGFEGAATLGEETRDPRRNIPRAVWVSVLLLGAFYTLCMYVQIIGFGIDQAGIEAFAGSSGTLADLGQMYVGSAFSVVIAIGAVASALASVIGCTTAGSRVLFALSRDGFGPSALGNLSTRGTPNHAVVTILGAAAVVMGLIALFPGGTDVANQFFWSATVASLTLVIVYAMTSLGVLTSRLRGTLFARKSVFDIVLPAASITFLAYVFWENRGTNHPYDKFPYLAAAWLTIGLCLVVLNPSLTGRIGRALTVSEGFRAAGSRQEAAPSAASAVTGERTD